MWEIVFVPSNVDPCIFYREYTIVLVYVDDSIIIAKEKGQIDDFLKSLIFFLAGQE